jgi:DNA sulfur modification protein DndE
MILKQIRLSCQSKDKLSRLKGRTGIQYWNILCRWALCYSLSESTIPAEQDIPTDSNVEMSWHTFTGEYHEIYDALVKAWCIRHKLPTNEDSLIKYFKLHLNRGISYLAGTNHIKNIDDLVSLTFNRKGAMEYE